MTPAFGLCVSTDHRRAMKSPSKKRLVISYVLLVGISKWEDVFGQIVEPVGTPETAKV
jgi:hypothetical protein